MEMIVKKGQYYKIDVVDVRWYTNGKPSRKGIRMNMDELDVLLKGLTKINNNYKVNSDESN